MTDRKPDLEDAVDLALLLGDTRTIDSIIAGVVRSASLEDEHTDDDLAEVTEGIESNVVYMFLNFLKTRGYIASPTGSLTEKYKVCMDLLTDSRRARRVLDKESDDRNHLSFEFVCTLPSQDPAFEDYDPIDFEMQQITSRLLNLCRESEESLVLVSPYLEVSGMDWLFPGLEGALERGVDLTLVSRELNDGEPNFRAIERLVAVAEECDGELTVYDYYQPRSDSDKPLYTLHSKVLLADGSTAYVGSANFTKYGFSENLEVGVVLQGSKVNQLADLLSHVIENNAVLV